MQLTRISCETDISQPFKGQHKISDCTYIFLTLCDFHTYLCISWGDKLSIAAIGRLDRKTPTPSYHFLYSCNVGSMRTMIIPLIDTFVISCSLLEVFTFLNKLAHSILFCLVPFISCHLVVEMFWHLIWRIHLRDGCQMSDLWEVMVTMVVAIIMEMVTTIIWEHWGAGGVVWW